MEVIVRWTGMWPSVIIKLFYPPQNCKYWLIRCPFHCCILALRSFELIVRFYYTHIYAHTRAHTHIHSWMTSPYSTGRSWTTSQTCSSLISRRSQRWREGECTYRGCSAILINTLPQYSAETGFKHVKPTEYQPRLLHFHGDKVGTI